jgi:pimeloyl-ACP methyl ester carboxylesterase
MKGEVSMSTIDHKGVKLAYNDQGAGKPAFIFAHGWTGSRSNFASQVSYFSRRHRVVSVDLRGHGESDKPEGPYPISAFADDLAYIIDQLELGKVMAVGHSMGASAVLQLAVRYPDQVAAIVMIDPGPFVIPPEVRTRLEKMVEAIESGNQEPRKQAIAAQMFLPTTDRKLVEDVTAVMLSTPNHVAASTMRSVLEFDGKSVAEQCKIPALQLVTALHRTPPHIMSEWLPTIVTGWTVGAGHFSQLEVPEQVNAMIEGFMRHYV